MALQEIITYNKDMNVNLYSLLIIDDNTHQIDFNVIADMLEGNPIHLMWAQGLKEANEVIENRKVDYIISDFSLSGESMTGEDWIQAHKNELQNVKISMLTGFTERIKDREALEEDGVTVYVRAEEEEDELWADVIGEAKEFQKRRSGITDACIDLFEKWATSKEDYQEKQISFGLDVLSLKDIVELTKQGDSRGELFLEAFVEEMQDTMNNLQD